MTLDLVFKGKTEHKRRMLTSPLRVMERGSNVSFGLNDTVLAIDTHESPF